MDGAPVKPGDVLAGRYRVEKVLGSGAMGVVVAATHVQLDRRVAIKLLQKHCEAKEYEDRFSREARAAGKLQSQHVAKVLDFGALESGEPYIVMEYLDGQDVAATLHRRGVMDIGEAVTLILQACDALAEAHALGIVHRDIKPANLFLTRSTDGSPCLKLVDFGVAKMRDGGLSLTRSDASLGSPLYMAPEVMNGKAKEVDGRADIWSLGVTFYEMLAGRSPFARETMEQLMKAIFFDPPPPIAQYRSEVPAGLGAVIEQALEKRLDRRFPNVASFAAALAPYAPARALSYVERIAKVQGVDLAPVSGPTPSTAHVAPARTAAEAPAARGRLTALVALVIAGACVAALVLVLRQLSAPSASPSPSGATPTREAAAVPAEPASTSSPSVSTLIPAIDAPVPKAPAGSAGPRPKPVPRPAPAPFQPAPPGAGAPEGPRR